MLLPTLPQKHQSFPKNVSCYAFKVTLIYFSSIPTLLFASAKFAVLFVLVLLNYACGVTGIAERVADIKTRAQAMKCLTSFCEAVGPGFVFERVCTI